MQLKISLLTLSILKLANNQISNSLKLPLMNSREQEMLEQLLIQLMKWKNF
jgi:hypothetical protein